MKINQGKQSKSRRMLIYGEPGVGKSTLASKFPKPLFLNIEDGIRDLDCDHTDQIRSLRDFQELVTTEVPSTDYATIVIDTVDWLEKLLSVEVAKAAGKTTIEDIGFGRGYQSLAKSWQDVFNGLTFLWNQGRHIVFTCHAAIERFSDPEGDGYNYYKPALHKTGSACVVEWCDEVLFCKHERLTKKADDGKRTVALQGNRVIVCNNMQSIEAKNRLGMPDYLPMTIESFYPFLKKNDIQAVATVATASSPVEEQVTF
jgi:phage nucleotide-binding protein